MAFHRYYLSCIQKLLIIYYRQGLVLVNRHTVIAFIERKVESQTHVKQTIHNYWFSYNCALLAWVSAFISPRFICHLHANDPGSQIYNFVCWLHIFFIWSFAKHLGCFSPRKAFSLVFSISVNDSAIYPVAKWDIWASWFSFLFCPIDHQVLFYLVNIFWLNPLCC